MKNLLFFCTFLIFVQFGFGQALDSLPKGLEKYYSLSYPERLDSVIGYIRTNRLKPDESYNHIFLKELESAKEEKVAALILAEILGHKMRVEAQLDQLIRLSKTAADLRALIQAKGDLTMRDWKVLLGKTHIFFAHIAYYKHEDIPAREEMSKAIKIFEEYGESELLSECFSEMIRYYENDQKINSYYFHKLDSIGKIIPTNRFIASGVLFKIDDLSRRGKHQAAKELINSQKDSIMAAAPWLSYTLNDLMAQNAFHLKEYQKAYDLYQPYINELRNKQVLPTIAAQIATVRNYTVVLKKMKRFEQASKYQDTLSTILQEEYEILSDAAILESQARYQKLEDEQKIKELKLQKETDKSKSRSTIFGMLALFAITISGIALWMYRKRQQQRETFLLSSKEKETQQVREKLLTSITHELRTPLSIISGKLESLGETNNEKEKELHLEVAKRNSKQLIEQINQLLEWNKLEANALSLHPSIGDAEQEIEKTLQELKPIAAHKNIDWNIGVKEQNFKGKLDFQKFKTIARNLLSNAIKYAPADSSIILKLFQENTQLVFSVQDFGQGIPSEDLPKIFDWYYRSASNTSEMKYEGFGIGLALSKELAMLMKGSLEVTSTEGKGSIFTLKLPFKNILTRNSSIAQQTSSLASNTLVSKNDKVESTLLIIEDHPDLAAHIATLFQDDFNIFVAHTYEQGIRIAEIEIPDLIISDVMLPDGNGLDLCKKLKSQLITDHIPVVMLTARGDKETRFGSLESRADAFLNKPFNNKELRLTVLSLLKNRRILQLKFGNSKEALSSTEDPFSRMVLKALSDHYGESEFNVDSFAHNLSLSKGQAYRKIRATFDSTPKKLIRNYRLEQAKLLLQKGELNISEIAYHCGFSSPEYFSTLFKEVYKKSPSDYRSSE